MERTMSNSRPGIIFSELLEGGITLNEVDPVKGGAEGERAGTIMRLHATIEIHDLRRFIGNPDHAGLLRGSIDYPTFDMNIPCREGSFHLLSPADDPKRRQILYETSFEHAGQNYYLVGRKDIRQG
jgi:hypothetical protein